MKQETCVLIVEDSIEWQKRLRRHLERQGLAVDVAKNLAEVRDKLKENTYWLATVDIELGESDQNQDGLKVLEMLNQRDILAIVVEASTEKSGQASKSVIEETYRPFAYFYKHETYNLNDFRAAVQMALAHTYPPADSA